MVTNNESLWAPWRMGYVSGLGGETHDALAKGADQPQAGAGNCFMCEASESTPGTELGDAAMLLVQDQRGALLLNRFPYSSGHLLVVPHAHVPTLNDLTRAQRHGLMDLAALAEQLLREAYNPQGVNVGINIGRCAGAGLPGHLHMHVVPRWAGDTNFMTVVGQIRIMPQSLEESFKMLTEALRRIGPSDD